MCMNTREAYNIWSEQYDTNENKTRDLEAFALRETLSKISFADCLEIGCGTGKNTQWFATKAKHLTAIDFSEDMLAKAKVKVASTNVEFIQADIMKDWSFTNSSYDLVTFSLVLEHIENLEVVFENVLKVLNPGGRVYVGELHPFKQYNGTKARFETKEGLYIVECYNHHVSDFVQAGKQSGLILEDLNEYFDEEKVSLPRILTLVMKKL